MQQRELPAGWERDLPVFPADPKGLLISEKRQPGSRSEPPPGAL